jgi:hypothetical protein
MNGQACVVGDLGGGENDERCAVDYGLWMSSRGYAMVGSEPEDAAIIPYVMLCYCTSRFFR